MGERGDALRKEASELAASVYLHQRAADFWTALNDKTRAAVFAKDIATIPPTVTWYLAIAAVFDMQDDVPPAEKWTIIKDMKLVDFENWGTTANYGTNSGQKEASVSLMTNATEDADGIHVWLRKEDFTRAGMDPLVAHYTGVRLQSKDHEVWGPGQALEWVGHVGIGRFAVWSSQSTVSGDDSEMDMMERFVSLGMNRWNFIAKYPPGIVQHYVDTPSTADELTVRVEWACPDNPNDIVMFVNDLEVNRVAKTYITSNRHLIRVQAACGGVNDPVLPADSELPSEMVVHYLHILEPATP